MLIMKETNIIQSGSLVGGEVLTMKETNIVQSGSLVRGGEGSVDHEGHQHHPEREPCR